MTTLTITAKGQVTFRKELLQHLGVAPGSKVDVNLLPGGRIEVKAVQQAGAIDNFIGLLQGKTQKRATIEEINDAAASGWSGKSR